MVDLRDWHSVHALVTLISNCWKVHVCSLIRNFDSLEFSIMEVVGIVNILYFSGVNFTLKVPEVFLAEIQLIIGGKLLVR